MTLINRLLKARLSGIHHALPLSLIPATILAAGAVLALGCGSGVRVVAPASPPESPASGPQTYLAGAVDDQLSSGALGFTNFLGTYTFDDSAKTFSQSTDAFGSSASVFSTAQDGPELNYSGTFTPLARGLLSLATSYADSANGPMTFSPPKPGTWAFELAGQAGGLVAAPGSAFTPLVAAASCPSSSTAQSFQFVTIPSARGGSVATYQPGVDTAYGSVDVSATEEGTLFSNIQQFTSAGTEVRNYSTIGVTPAPVAYTSITGDCSPTFYGNTISVPGSVDITDPGDGETYDSTAIVGVGQSGLLIESNGNGYTSPSTSNGSHVSPVFQPFMGAGTGAIGLPKPSSPLATSDLIGAQYLGFFYAFDGSETSPVASFGFPSPAAASCAAVTAQTATLIYGGDFTNNDPSASDVQANGGFGNCDVAIDLGVQDSSNDGLFPNAVVTEGANFASNTTGTAEVLPAVAIAGTLNGKFAIFLISTAGQGIYLMQSN